MRTKAIEKQISDCKYLERVDLRKIDPSTLDDTIIRNIYDNKTETYRKYYAQTKVLPWNWDLFKYHLTEKYPNCVIGFNDCQGIIFHLSYTEDVDDSVKLGFWSFGDIDRPKAELLEKGIDFVKGNHNEIMLKAPKSFTRLQDLFIYRYGFNEEGNPTEIQKKLARFGYTPKFNEEHIYQTIEGYPENLLVWKGEQL